MNSAMPGDGGLKLRRWSRKTGKPTPANIILLTSRAVQDDILEGLERSADDDVTKPFNSAELRTCDKGGWRILGLRPNLAERVLGLEGALTSVRQPPGLFPICSYGKKIRDDWNYWQQVETCISEHSDAVFSHAICPDCFDKHVRPELAKPTDEEESR